MAAASVNQSVISNPMLNHAFVVQSRRDGAEYNEEVEATKDNMALFALSIFDQANGRDLPLRSEEKISSHFSKEEFGGNARALVTLFSYLVTLHENKDFNSPGFRTFVEKINEISNELLSAVKSNDRETMKMTGSKIAEIDHFPASYVVTKLPSEPAHKILPNGSLKCKVKIHESSGHLIAEIDEGFSKELLETYRPEIEKHLSAEGARHLQLPDIYGHVVLAFRWEYDSEKLPERFLNTKIGLSFKDPYIVPARGDNRYSLVGSVFVDFESEIREQLGLQPFPKERPPRITFAAVRNQHLQDSNESLLARLENCPEVEPWLKA